MAVADDPNNPPLTGREKGGRGGDRLGQTIAQPREKRALLSIDPTAPAPPCTHRGRAVMAECPTCMASMRRYRAAR
jgi:hypothetical protein